MVEKSEFWRPRLRGIPYFSTLKWFETFILLLYLLTLKFSCVQLKQLKSLNFGGHCLEGTPHFGTPIFVRFSLFLISTNSKNLIHLALMIWFKSSKFWQSRLRGTPILKPQTLSNFIFPSYLPILQISCV